MTKDVVPELLEAIEKDFDAYVQNNSVIQGINKRIREGLATAKEANQFAVEVGKALAEAFKHNLSSEVLPDGKMYYNIAKRILEKTMGNNHEIIAAATAQVQRGLNRAAGIGIGGVKAPLNQRRIEGLVKKISNADDYDKVKHLLDEPVVNFSQAVADQTVKANVDFHFKAGLKPVIVRKSSGGCKWCNDQAGEYDYPQVPDDVYRRHRYCRCRLEYNPGNGTKQNVWTKQEAGSAKDKAVQLKQKEKQKKRDKLEAEVRKYEAGARKLKQYTEKNAKIAKRKNVGLSEKSALPYNKDTIAKIEKKIWSDSFKARALSFYRQAHDRGHEFSVHSVSRVMERAREAGVSNSDILKACGSRPMYKQEDGRLIYPAKNGAYLIQNPKTKDFVTCLVLDKPKREWITIGEDD